MYDRVVARDELISKLRTELLEAEAYCADLRDMIRRLSSRDRAGPSSTVERQTPRRGSANDTRQLALRVLAENSRPWSIPDLAQEMQAREWSTKSADPLNALRAAMSRLHNAGRVEQVGNGRYKIASAGVGVAYADGAENQPGPKEQLEEEPGETPPAPRDLDEDEPPF